MGITADLGRQPNNDTPVSATRVDAENVVGVSTKHLRIRGRYACQLRPIFGIANRMTSQHAPLLVAQLD